MTDRASTIGGPGGDFPVTSWGMVLNLQRSTSEERSRALETLCRRYWKPVVIFARRAWSKSIEDAKDLAQAFFLDMIDGEALSRYSPERGGFRTYLKMLLRRFEADQHDAARALKRGGRTRTLTLDDSAAPLKEFVADASASTPEDLFDQEWKKQVLERAIDRTKRFFADAGRGRQFEVFEAYDLSSDGKATYGQIGERLGLKETVVRNYLFEVRERLRGEIRAELSQTVASLDQLEEEWTALFGGKR